MQLNNNYLKGKYPQNVKKSFYAGNLDFPKIKKLKNSCFEACT